jgi:hypothetical protein
MRCRAIGRRCSLRVDQCVGGVRIMSRRATFFSCPHCKALYQIIKTEAGPESDEDRVACRACGEPLVGREGRYLLKYFHFRDASNRRRYGPG